jgi:hypothetical protein
MSEIIHQARRSARSALLVAAILGLPACSGGGPTEPKQSGKVTGTYVLEAADHEELPAAIHRGAYLDPETGIFFNNYIVEMKDGYIELRENETFFLSFELHISADGQVGEGTVDFEGEWDEVQDGIVLRIQWPIVATIKLGRRDDGPGLHTDLDLLGLGEETHLDFDFFKR